MAEYYVQLLTDINEKGADFINDERDRLHVILQSSNPRGEINIPHVRPRCNCVKTMAPDSQILDTATDHLKKKNLRDIEFSDTTRKLKDRTWDIF